MQNTNTFSERYAKKSTYELKAILDSQKDYQEEAIQAARWELDKRQENGTEAHKEHSVFFEKKGEELYEDFLKTVEKKSSFAWKPNFSESFTVALSQTLIQAITEQAIAKLDWHLVYISDFLVEAKIENGFQSISEKVKVSFDHPNEVCVKSVSLKGGVWDMGRNSKKVKLFIHVFQEIAAEYSDQGLKELEEEINRRDNWDDYEVPESLPSPRYTKEAQLVFPLVFGMLGAVLMGGLFAIATKFFYIIMLYELGIGIALAFILHQGVKWGNYTNFSIIRGIQIAAVFAIVLLTQYFQFLIIVYENPEFELTFIQFMKLRLEAGFIFQDLNTGWIGWIVVFILQLLTIYFVSLFRLSMLMLNFLFNRVPEEVVNFAYYHFVKGKSEVEVRNELAIKGWGDRIFQDQVMEAIGSVHERQEFMRAE